MKKLLTIMIMTLALIAFGVATAEAAVSDTISVTVKITAAALDVTVTPDAWPIGDISAGDTPDTTAETEGPDYFTATSGRTNATEDLTLTVACATGWTFADTVDKDQFAMKFCLDGTEEFPAWTSITVATGGSLADDLAASGTVDFDLQLLAPDETAIGGTTQIIVVTVTAS